MAKTLARAADSEAIRKRLLRADSERLWGTMSVEGVMCYLTDHHLRQFSA